MVVQRFQYKNIDCISLDLLRFVLSKIDSRFLDRQNMETISRLYVTPCINPQDRPRFIIEAVGKGVVNLTLIVSCIQEFWSLIELTASIVTLRQTHSIIYNWTHLPESIRETVKSQSYWEILNDIARKGVKESPSEELDNFFDKKRVQEPQPTPQPAPRSAPSQVRTKETSQARLSKDQIDKYARDAIKHASIYGSHPPLVASGPPKTLERAVNYIRDQLNLRHLDTQSLEAIVRAVEQSRP